MNLFRKLGEQDVQLRKHNRILSILLIALAIVAVFALIFRLAFGLGKETNFVNDPLDYIFDFSQKKSEICTTNDTLEYFYYEEPKENAQNNKFGLYVYAEDPDFIKLADKLVNSTGGDWGYVLIPYNVDDRDFEKWRTIFDLLSEKHLIPIIQLHDTDDDEYESELDGAAEFLNTFIWPIKQRYISVYNEPNDSKFWFDRIEPGEYAKVLSTAVDKFKQQNQNFFIMNGALNVSAANTSTTMDSFEFMKLMAQEKPRVFEKLDGWASHSYPQPNFSGDVFSTGRASIRAYQDELFFLKNSLGVSKDLPVFITETGWAHAEGEEYNSSFLPADAVGANLELAFNDIWLKDESVIAVTPFTIWFEAPFDHFSWVNTDKVPYKHYEMVKSLQKVPGSPQKLVRAIINVESNNGIECK